MSEDLDRIKDALRRAVPPMAQEGLRRDLWPDLARRMTARQVVWFDWIIGAAALAASVGLPAVVPMLFYLL